jgi:hypothetical protein
LLWGFSFEAFALGFLLLAFGVGAFGFLCGRPLEGKRIAEGKSLLKGKEFLKENF